MSRVLLSQAAFDDLLRLDEFLAESGDPLAGDLLEHSIRAFPLLGDVAA